MIWLSVKFCPQILESKILRLRERSEKHAVSCLSPSWSQALVGCICRVLRIEHTRGLWRIERNVQLCLEMVIEA